MVLWQVVVSCNESDYQSAGTNYRQHAIGNMPVHRGLYSTPLGESHMKTNATMLQMYLFVPEPAVGWTGGFCKVLEKKRSLYVTIFITRRIDPLTTSVFVAGVRSRRCSSAACTSDLADPQCLVGRARCVWRQNDTTTNTPVGHNRPLVKHVTMTE